MFFYFYVILFKYDIEKKEWKTVCCFEEKASAYNNTHDNFVF